MTELWINEAKWEREWEGHEILGQGGQGVTRRVENRNTGQVGCVKILSKQNDKERRMRFAREATAYDTCSHPLIPRLLVSNAHNHADTDYKLFLVTEYVCGPTLTQLIDEKERIDWIDGLKLTIALLGVVKYLHDNDWVHRDIKPDNIILRDRDVTAPVLLDFGLSYKEDIAETLDTEHGQEMGNRFLRLPELSIGSTTKRDDRSDLSFIGGILFYVLTGTLPATLQDSEGRMPHQRPVCFAQLSRIAGAAAPVLFDFLDRCFNPVLIRRHANAASMQAILETLLNCDVSYASGPDDDLAFIKSHLTRDSVVEVQLLGANCQGVYGVIDRIVGQLVRELNGRYVRTQGGMQQRGASVHTNLGVAQADNHEIRFSPRWEIDVRGSEIVVGSSSNFQFRLDAIAPDMGGEFSSNVKSHILKGIRGLIEAPAQQVVYRGFFKETPSASLPEALSEASRVGKRVFAVLYDDKHAQLSKLDYTLGNFMEYEETKQLVLEQFVVALIPVSDALHLIPSGMLETARWFLLGADGSILGQEDVYANPTEGLKVVKTLAIFAK
jgi:serine/threonine protein kinase